MSRRNVICCLAVVVVGATVVVSDAFADDPADKLGRGISNVLFGWGEFFRQTEIAAEEKGTVPGVFVGAIHGTLQTIRRTTIGAIEILTFPLPDKPGYKPMIEPEFVFSDVGKREHGGGPRATDYNYDKY